MTEDTPTYDTGPLALYTPSLMSPERLEQLFVAREDVLDDLVRRIETSATSSSRRHRLLVGRRGAGKTHLMALAAHRARQLPGFGDTFLLSWLPEDPWVVDDVDDLLRLVLDHLDPAAEWDRTHDPEQALLRTADGRPVVVLMENLDQILEAIGRPGQQRLRRLLESERTLLLLATTTQLSHDLVDESVPFHGFFDTSPLEPFTVDEAREQLTAIARERGDDALAEYLSTREGTARLRTVTHLAGGQPRIWSLLSGAMDVAGLDDVVSLLLPKIDELTPYYQEQLARLSPQQRKVVRHLGEANHACSVKDIATATGIAERTIGRTVRDLVARGWLSEVDSPLLQYVDGRLTYYELAEPLARVVFQVKLARGEPVELLVDFLRAWFDIDELAGSNSEHLQLATGFEYLRAAIERFVPRMIPDGAIRTAAPTLQPEHGHLLEAVDDALAQLQSGNADSAFLLPTPTRLHIEHCLATGFTVGLLRLSLHGIAPHSEAASWLNRARDLAADELVDRWLLDVMIARWLALDGELESATALVKETVTANILEIGTFSTFDVYRLVPPDFFDLSTWIIGSQSGIERLRPWHSVIIQDLISCMTATRLAILGVASQLKSPAPNNYVSQGMMGYRPGSGRLPLPTDGPLELRQAIRRNNHIDEIFKAMLLVEDNEHQASLALLNNYRDDVIDLPGTHVASIAHRVAGAMATYASSPDHALAMVNELAVTLGSQRHPQYNLFVAHVHELADRWRASADGA